MTEITVESTIVRLSQEQLQKAIIDNKIVVLKGLKGSGKKAAAIAELEKLNKTFTVFSKVDYKSENEGEYGWEKLLFSENNKEVVLFDEAEFLDNWDQFLETALSSDLSFSLLLISSFEPAMDEAYAMALENAGALIHWLPVSFYELAQALGMGKIDAKLEEVLNFGTLQSVLDSEDKRAALLSILEYWQKGQWSKEDRINKRDLQLKVLKILAFQMGEILSFNEIGTKVGLDNETVERYVQLFEKAYLIQTIPNFTTGKKYEMKKGITVYFTDNGIRNALIENFSEMDWRNDSDQLWRNWLLMERQKMIVQKQLPKQLFTWRSLTKTAVDIVEFGEDQTQAYQVAWNKKEKRKFPLGFKNNYPNAKYSVLNRASYWSFLSSKK
ncbi:MAG: AAA family ATPase [Bacteroidetes bacterium]|nr:AAA family ATPase [Bacteroidota bacterium]